MALLKKLIASIICIFSAFFVVMAVSDLITGAKESGLMIGLIVFFGGTFFAGARLYRSGMRDSAAPVAQREVAVLQLAREAGGTIGPSDVGARLRLPFAEARLTLENLRKQGACNLVVTDTGAELYRFPDLVMTTAQAQSARDLLDR